MSLHVITSSLAPAYYFTGVVFIHAELQKNTDIFGSTRFYVLTVILSD